MRANGTSCSFFQLHVNALLYDLAPIFSTVVGTALPGHLAFGSWRLVHCTARDGYSLQQLYRKAAGLQHTLLVVQVGCYPPNVHG